MPVKRRKRKRRVDPVAEAEAWGEMFDAGFDFFGEAADLTGLTEPVHVPPEARAAAEKAWTAAALDAWRRVGRLFLDRINDQDGTPWALKTFGEPERCR